MRMRYFLLLFLYHLVDSVCFPEEIISECIKRKKGEKEQEETVSTTTTTTTTTTSSTEYEFEDDLFESRSFGGLGKRCTSRFGGGACVGFRSCRSSSYGYSRTCGINGLICCKNKRPFSLPAKRTRPVTTIRRKPSFFTTTSSPSPPPKRGEEKCGVSALSLNIWGGTKAEKDDLPWMVSFINQWGSNFCGGVLISRKHILTAAHCFDSRDWRRSDVRIAQVDITEREEVGTEGRIRSVKIHERYEKNGAPYSERVTPLNDIALVTLHRAVTSRSATPICLPERTRVFPDGQGVVAGWGQVTRSKGKASTELLYAEIDVFNATHCTQKYSDFVNGDTEIFDINDKMICGGNNKADTCRGDSGGPLMYNELWTNLRWQIQGIVSFGPKTCGSDKLPGVFTKVDKYLPWIRRNMKF